MPRYFFNVIHEREIHRDPVGQDFATESDALKEARLVAGELVRDAAFCNRSLDYTLEVSDGSGAVIIRFHSSDLEFHRNAGEDI